MPNADSRASLELVLGLYELMRNVQASLNDVTISNWAVLAALVERDETFMDIYLAHKEKTEASELGQRLGAMLQEMNETLARMQEHLR